MEYGRIDHRSSSVRVAGNSTITTTANSVSRDGGASWAQSLGVSGAVVTSADASAAAIDVTDAPAAGQRIVVDDILFSGDTAIQFTFKEETSGTVYYSPYIGASVPAQITPRGKLKLTTADKKLQLQTSVAGNISVTVLWHSEA